jgi:hypothetical protein
MSGKVNKPTYEQLIQEDINWLTKNTEDTLERRHIIAIVKDSVNSYYTPAGDCPASPIPGKAHKINGDGCCVWCDCDCYP